MRDVGLRRAQSPGSRSRSPSRYRSPAYRSRSRSLSRSRSRSRSRSSWHRRSISRSPLGRYSRSPLKRYSHSPDLRRKQSFSTADSSESSDEPGQVRDRAKKHGQGMHHRRHQPQQQQQQQGGRQSGPDQRQVQALQQQLQTEQVARAAAEHKAELLKSKLLQVADRSKARGNSLAALLGAVRRFADAKQQLSAAEADLQQAMHNAEAFLQDEAAAAPVQDAAVAAIQQQQCQQPPDEELVHEDGHAAASVHAEAAAYNGQDSGGSPPAPPAAAREEQAGGGGWVQASNDVAASPRKAPLSNIRFSLKL